VTSDRLAEAGCDPRCGCVEEPVPREGLDAFAVDVERFEMAFDSDLAAVAGGEEPLRACAGVWLGETFAARWLQERRERRGECQKSCAPGRLTIRL
jgi:hypothetical protein